MWTHAHTELISAAAEDPAVERIFVNAAIKKALCREAGHGSRLAGEGAAVVGARLSLSHSAFIVRPTARNASRSRRHHSNEGCGHELDHWFLPGVRYPSAAAPNRPKPKTGTTMASFAGGLPTGADGAVRLVQDAPRPNSACCAPAARSVTTQAQPTITAA